MKVGSVVARLTRLDSSLLAALAIFVPQLTRTKDVPLSTRRALPLLLIGMCTFVANDIDDIEKDRTNHPDRPLPSGQISPPLACAIYFLCLILALFTTRWFVDPEIAIWYYALLTLSISYGYVVDFFPSFKSPYVAIALAIPIVIGAQFFPEDPRFYPVAIAACLFTLGREVCMDLLDRTGDRPSLIHRIGPTHLGVVAISSQAAALVLLAFQAQRPFDSAALLLMATVLIASAICWFRLALPQTAIQLMKLQMLLGLAFLL